MLNTHLIRALVMLTAIAGAIPAAHADSGTGSTGTGFGVQTPICTVYCVENLLRDANGNPIEDADGNWFGTMTLQRVVTPPTYTYFIQQWQIGGVGGLNIILAIDACQKARDTYIANWNANPKNTYQCNTAATQDD